MKINKPPSPAEVLHERFEQHLLHQRGLSERSLQAYRPFVHSFLVECVFNAGSVCPGALEPQDVRDFLLTRIRKRPTRSGKLLSTALRSLLRFLFQSGETAADLSLAIPTVRHWRQATVHSYLVPEEVEQVLHTCNRATPIGRRDYAVLLLLARLGFRAGEVIALELGDISTWADRFDVIRRFAVWRSVTDPRTEIPPRRLLPHRRRRNAPYIYKDEEIEQLMAEASRLLSPKGLRALTYTALFGLLASTGLRPGEGINLHVADVDLLGGILASLVSSLFTNRPVRPWLSIQNSATASVNDPRLIHSSSPSAAPGFITRLRHILLPRSRAIGLRVPTVERRKGCGPRLMDLRHRFATRKLIEWYRAGLDVEREMPKLATYLGHVHVRHTYWYIEAVPELLQLATERLSQQGQEVTL